MVNELAHAFSVPALTGAPPALPQVSLHQTYLHFKGKGLATLLWSTGDITIHQKTDRQLQSLNMTS